MQVLPAHTIAPGHPSPTLTNPDMILPWDHAPSSSVDSSPTTDSRPHGTPSTAPTELRVESVRKFKSAGQHSLSPFRNGVLTQAGAPARTRSTSERGDGRIRFENSRLSYKPSGDVLLASSPTLRNDNTPSRRRVVIRPDDDDDGNDAPGNSKGSDVMPDNTYTTPAILEEDDENPNSHMAMSKRAEEILAIAKLRLNNMEGNLNRARSTLNSRPSSSMSSFSNHGSGGPSGYALRNGRIETRVQGLSKHRQGPSEVDSNRQGHSRVFSETSVPSSLQTGYRRDRTNGHLPMQSDVTPSATDQPLEPSRWFWNGLNRGNNLTSRHKKSLEPLDEDESPSQSFAKVPVVSEGGSGSDECSGSLLPDDLENIGSSFSTDNSSSSGLTRARSTAQLRDIRDQMQDLKGKITTLKRRARQDSLYRRSLQNLRTPSPFTAADTTEQWYHEVPLAAERQAMIDPDLQRGAVTSSDQGAKQPEVISDKERNAMLENKTTSENDETPKEMEHGIAEDLSEPAATTGGPHDPMVNGVGSRDDQHEHLMDDVDADAPSTAANTAPIPTMPEASLDRMDPNLTANEEGDTARDSTQSNLDQENGDSMLVFQEASMESVGERHEDREDAFDYRNRFLFSETDDESREDQNSSGSSLSDGSRSNSASSIYSAETTKPGDEINDADLREGTEADRIYGHFRKESVDSVSTAATFATATEGMDITEEPEEESTPRNTIVGVPRLEKSIGRGLTPRMRGPQKWRHERRERLARPIVGTRAPSNSLSTPSDTSPVNGVVSLPAVPSLLTYLASIPSNRDHDQDQEPRLPSRPIKLGDGDRDMAERVIRSLAQVCISLEAASGAGPSKYEARICRRKLDSARRVLDGEVNGEAF